MFCFVTHSDSVVCEFVLPDKARGEELLDAVCNKLAIIECDYFGLQFVGPKGENLWLNTRNKICRQVSGGQPFRFQFKGILMEINDIGAIKYCTDVIYELGMNCQTNAISLDVSFQRHQFFQHLKKDIEERRINPEVDRLPRIFALLAQATIGDHDNSYSYSGLDNRHQPEGESEQPWSTDFRNEVALEHKRLKSMKPSTSEYYFIQEISAMDSYGIEFHAVKSHVGDALHVGVGSKELKIYDMYFNFVERISYNVLKMATHVGKTLVLTVSNFEEENVVQFRLPTQEAACALYRSITEYHAFFRCETVRTAVKSQFTKDFKETLISLFGDEESERKYIFDVKRTCREVYDHCRRTLYRQGCDPILRLPGQILQLGNNNSDSVSCENGSSDEVNQLQQQLSSMHDAFCCKICMDKQINAVFCPCGHMMSCSDCAANVQHCPICRGEIDHTQVVFLPIPTNAC